MPTLLSEVPQIKAHPQSQMVHHGDDVTLITYAVGKDLTFKWYKCNRCLPNEDGPLLHLKKLSLRDAGRYSCHVSNSRDSVVTWAIIDVVPLSKKRKPKVT